MPNLITLDFETYYDKEYGLKKFTTEEYIRDEKFEVIGVAVKDKGVTKWFTGTHEETKDFLNQYDFANSFALGHNMRFDAAILSWHFDIHPLGLFDTMSMAQILHGLTESVSLANLSQLYQLGEKGTEVLDALGKRRLDFTHNDLAKYGSYCINDVELTYELFTELKDKFTAPEMKLIDLTIRMFTEPKLELNKGLLIRHLHEVKEAKEKLLATVCVEAIALPAGTDRTTVDKEVLMSNPKFAELLLQQGVNPPMKISSTTGRPTYAFAKTDEQFKALLEHDNPYVQALAAARIGNKSTIEETRTENFIQIANRGKLPVPLKYAGAVVSHRWSGVDGINLQNLPRTSELRRAICAPKGYKIVASDLSNIELRLAYWFAKSQRKMQLIKDGVDLYIQSASDITSVKYEEVNKDLRYIFKVVNLSGIYGVGADKMQSILKQGGVEKDIREVKLIVNAYRKANPELIKAWADAGEMLEAVRAGQVYSMGNGGIITSVPHEGMMKPNGMMLGLPNLRKLRTDRGESWAYDKLMGRTLIPEYIHPSKTFQRCIQSLARDIIAEQLIQVAKRYPVVMTVHDELVMLCKDEEVDECKAYVEKCMTTAPYWCSDLPLNCEIGVGDNYMDAK
jgi:DNA polymerase I-like protein with 3'-5' exonuclease and polymerase domains